MKRIVFNYMLLVATAVWMTVTLHDYWAGFTSGVACCAVGLDLIRLVFERDRT